MIRSVPSVYTPTLAPSTTICRSSRNNAYIPKLEPFSRSKIDRIVKDPPLIQKSENDLADYCSTLDGDRSYSCWRAYFELKDLEKEAPKEVVERVILESGGVKSLIGCLHGISEIHKVKRQLEQERGSDASNMKVQDTHLESIEAGRACPVPDGLPKSREEMEEEEKGRMPDSPFTRLLRSKGRSPAWFLHFLMKLVACQNDVLPLAVRKLESSLLTRDGVEDTNTSPLRTWMDTWEDSADMAKEFRN